MLMVKKGELIPKPESLFVKVKCPDCGNEQITFNKASIQVNCNVCGAVLGEPRGGKLLLKGEIVERLG